MQETRQDILDILREIGEATVEDIVVHLRKRRADDITAVTVRHHLNVLQEENLITLPQTRQRTTPGRPQHIYTLTEKAQDLFPNNYQQLAIGMIDRLRQHLPPANVNVILEGVALDMARDAQIPDVPMPERLNVVVEYLTQQGYNAHWESCEQGYLLHTANCPYHHIANHDQALCEMDMHLIASLIGVIPRRTSHAARGDATCSYIIPQPQA